MYQQINLSIDHVRISNLKWIFKNVFEWQFIVMWIVISLSLSSLLDAPSDTYVYELMNNKFCRCTQHVFGENFPEITFNKRLKWIKYTNNTFQKHKSNAIGLDPSNLINSITDVWCNRYEKCHLAKFNLQLK